MSKFLYPIKKLEIMPWIKYWLINKTKGTLSGLIEGTSPLTLENSIRKKFHVFNVNGNTIQNGDPTPEAPIPVENVSGEVEVKVENKNLCTNENIGNNSPVLSTLYESYTGPITIAVKTTSGTAQVNYRLVYEDGTVYNNYVMTANQANNVWRIAKYTAPKPIKRIGLYYISSGETRTAEHIMFLKGTYTTITDADYEPHKEQTATFPLAEGQVLHLGDTLEDDGIHQRKYTKVFDGTEQISIRVWGDYYRVQLLISNAKTYSTNVQHNQLCSHFNYNDTGVFDINADIKVGMFAQYRDAKNFYFVTDKTSVDNFESWLAEQYTNGTPVTLEYELATPITIPYTAEQQTAYDNLKNLYSYKGTTYISSTNEPSPVFEVQYYMEEGA